MAYRLFADFPLVEDQTKSIELSQKIVEFLHTINIDGVKLCQYKLSHDDDRANKNYLDIDQQGHCSNKKFKINF